jgi:hypothetical protein
VATFLGMNPEQATAHAASLRAQLDALDTIAAQLQSSVTASVYPTGYGYSSGDTAIAPYSLHSATSAQALLRSAVTSARALADRVLNEASGQEEASSNTPPVCLPVPPVMSQNHQYQATLPQWWSNGYWGMNGGMAHLGAAVDPKLWSGRYSTYMYTKPYLIPNPALFDAPSGMYRMPSTLLVPGSAAPQVTAPGTGQWGFRPVGPSAAQANGMAPKVPSWVKFGGKALGPASAIVGGATVGYNSGVEQWNADAGLSDELRWNRSVYRGTVEGTATGGSALVGAAGGALAGAAIGSIFPGPGTLIGGIVGGIIGGIAGSTGGEALGEFAADQSIDHFYGEP